MPLIISSMLKGSVTNQGGGGGHYSNEYARLWTDDDPLSKTISASNSPHDSRDNPPDTIYYTLPVAIIKYDGNVPGGVINPQDGNILAISISSYTDSSKNFPSDHTITPRFLVSGPGGTHYFDFGTLDLSESPYYITVPPLSSGCAFSLSAMESKTPFYAEMRLSILEEMSYGYRWIASFDLYDSELCANQPVYYPFEMTASGTPYVINLSQPDTTLIPWYARALRVHVTPTSPDPDTLDVQIDIGGNTNTYSINDFNIDGSRYIEIPWEFTDTDDQSITVEWTGSGLTSMYIDRIEYNVRFGSITVPSGFVDYPPWLAIFYESGGNDIELSLPHSISSMSDNNFSLMSSRKYDPAIHGGGDPYYSDEFTIDLLEFTFSSLPPAGESLTITLGNLESFTLYSNFQSPKLYVRRDYWNMPSSSGINGDEDPSYITITKSNNFNISITSIRLRIIPGSYNCYAGLSYY